MIIKRTNYLEIADDKVPQMMENDKSKVPIVIKFEEKKLYFHIICIFSFFFIQ